MSDVEDARRFAAQEVEHWVASDTPETRMSAEEKLLWWASGCEFAKGPYASFIIKHIGADKFLFSWSYDNPYARRLMTRIVTAKLLAGASLTRHESIFTALYVSGKLPPLPKKPGKNRGVLFDRNLFIIGAIKQLVTRFGLTPTRSDEKKSERQSACDLISEAFIAAGKHEVTYRAVKDVWGNKKLQQTCKSLWDVIDGQLALEEEMIRNYKSQTGEAGLVEGRPVNALAALTYGWPTKE